MFGSALTLGEWSNIFRTILSDTSRSVGERSIAAAYSKALKLGSPQLRNVARVGGSIFYTHPCSGLFCCLVCLLVVVFVGDTVVVSDAFSGLDVCDRLIFNVRQW